MVETHAAHTPTLSRERHRYVPVYYRRLSASHGSTSTALLYEKTALGVRRHGSLVLVVYVDVPMVRGAAGETHGQRDIMLYQNKKINNIMCIVYLVSAAGMDGGYLSPSHARERKGLKT